MSVIDKKAVEHISWVVDHGYCVEVKRKHLYKNTEGVYLILHFDNVGANIPQNKFSNVEDAVIFFLKLLSDRT